jgi:hypothetical protein
MLRRNMDDIFEDIVANEAPKDNKEGSLGLSSLGT